MCQRGDIYWAELPKIEDCSVQYGVRPVLLVANNMALTHSPVFQCIPLTTELKSLHLPIHCVLESGGTDEISMALGEQIITIGKKMLGNKIGTVSENDMRKVNKALSIQLGLWVYEPKKEKKCCA